MDIERIQKLNNLTKEYKKHDITLKPSDIVKLDETSDMSESEKVLRKLHFKIKYNEDAIGELKAMIGSLKEEIKELKEKHKEQVQETFNSQTEAKPEIINETKIETEEKQERFEPIDRDNTTPSEVAIDKIFYYGQK